MLKMASAKPELVSASRLAVICEAAVAFSPPAPAASAPTAKGPIGSALAALKEGDSGSQYEYGNESK